MYTKLFARNADEGTPATRAATVAKKLFPVFAAGCLVMFGLAGSGVAGIVPSAMSDAEILGIYIQVNGFDIETALLGRAQARSVAVRELAARVSSDHLGVRQTAFDLAAQCKVSPVLPGNREAAAIEHGRAMTKLTALEGLEFDKAYVQHEVAFHRAAIDAVRQLLQPSATCPALKAHFKSVLPALEQHLSATEELSRELAAR
jgi:putative membrane protein